MKNYILIMLIISMFTTSHAQWQTLNDGIIKNVRSIDFINENVGWIIGWNSIMKTEDGAETWADFPLTEDIIFYDIDFCNDSVAWAMGESIENGQQSIYKSNDGGQVWDLIRKFSEPKGLASFCAVNDSVVYAAGLISDTGYPSGWIMKTTDGGSNWDDILPFAPITYIDFNSIQFYDNNTGIVSGVGYDEHCYLRTLDGGNTWKEINTSEFIWIENIQFINNSTYYFLAKSEADTHFFCLSTDTLNSWSIKLQNEFDINSFFIKEDNTIFIVIDDINSTIVKSSEDGGNTWITNDTVWNGGEIFFPSQDLGLIVNSSTIHKSKDMGKNWFIDHIRYPFLDISFINNLYGFVCGGSGSCSHGWCGSTGNLFKTVNGGETWKRVFGFDGWGLGNQFKQCHFINESIGFLINQHAIYKSIDSGNSWIEIYQNPDDSSGYKIGGNDICFINEQIGWAVGDGIILSTIDGGDNWNIVKEYPDIYMSSIYTVNKTAWVVGENGIILKYNEQDQWRLYLTLTDLPLNDIFFSDDNHGWIAGGYLNDQDFQSLLLITSNGGETWIEKRISKYLINDMFFSDSMHGWAVGHDTSLAGFSGRGWSAIYHGMILKTEDGGDHWNVVIENLPAQLKALHFKDGIGWAVGENGLVLRTDNWTTWIDQSTGETYPSKYSLSQNYPNPFNPRTNIEYSVRAQHAVPQHVNLSIYNILGQKLATLVDKKQAAGSYQVQWDASGFASGVYLYTLETGNGYKQTKKLVLLK